MTTIATDCVRISMVGGGLPPPLLHYQRVECQPRYTIIMMMLMMMSLFCTARVAVYDIVSWSSDKLHYLRAVESASLECWPRPGANCCVMDSSWRGRGDYAKAARTAAGCFCGRHSHLLASKRLVSYARRD